MAMYSLSAKIEIISEKTWVFDKIVSAEVERSSESLTNTCRLTLPRKIKWQDEGAIPIRRGDAIKVWLGYGTENTLAFCGFVTSIGAKTPVVIECEDWMWKLKATPAVKKTYKTATIRQILDDQNLPFEVNVLGEQSLGAYRVSANTVAELLGGWKDQGVRSFFKYDETGKPTLYCGVIFEPRGGRVQVFDNRRNMTSADKLNSQSAADVKLKVKVVSLDAANKKTAVEVGDPEGEVRTLQTYGKTEAEAKAWGEQELERLKRDGLTGSFDAFGGYLVDTLDTIGVVLDGEKKGIYQVSKNTIRYGSGGLRQEIGLGFRVDGK